MKLWMIIVIMGNIGATIGPLPYDMKECEHRRDAKLAEIAADPVKKDLGDKKKIKLICEYREQRPTLGSKYDR